MPSTLDQFMISLASFMETGRIGTLERFCEPDANVDFFHIYRNGYLRSAIDAVAANYPATQCLLGEDYFRMLAKQFVLDSPPVTGSLSGYGAEFPEFLRKTELSRNLPYLFDVATIDRAWLYVYFAADDSSAPADEIAVFLENQSGADTKKIGLRNASAILSLEFPVLGIWQELKDTGGLKEITSLNKMTEHVLIWRKQSQVFVRQLPLPEFIFLSSLDEGLSLEDSAENALDREPTFELGLFFSNLITEELLKTKNH